MRVKISYAVRNVRATRELCQDFTAAMHKICEKAQVKLSYSEELQKQLHTLPIPDPPFAIVYLTVGISAKTIAFDASEYRQCKLGIPFILQRKLEKEFETLLYAQHKEV